jgi:hypothetical protein
MGLSAAIMIAALAILAVCLGSPRIRSLMAMIALRRFFDRYMSRPRYRVYNLRSREDQE